MMNTTNGIILVIPEPPAREAMSQTSIEPAMMMSGKRKKIDTLFGINLIFLNLVPTAGLEPATY